ncbi:PaaI family thioesterase [uncultured Sphingomonas sp.]|uniref:PaaI family thioesterase n=1 Tax=uncultured Sphingomonas sp. TaxID=158754 RepID=UPI0025E2CE64|nr:PaaI family thioesterase [uncultured Sphingomonas sp.]
MTSPPSPAPVFDPQEALASRRTGHIVALGLSYVAHGPDWCELALDYDRRLVSDAGSGILASGPIVSLMDTASGFAVWVRRGGLLPQATLDLRLDYLRPARPGQRVVGRAECYRLTRRVAFVRGVAHDGDPADPVAHLAGTYMLLEVGK